MVFVVSGLYTAIPLYQIYISSSSFLSEVPSLWLAVESVFLFQVDSRLYIADGSCFCVKYGFVSHICYWTFVLVLL